MLAGSGHARAIVSRRARHPPLEASTALTHHATINACKLFVLECEHVKGCQGGQVLHVHMKTGAHSVRCRITLHVDGTTTDDTPCFIAEVRERLTIVGHRLRALLSFVDCKRWLWSQAMHALNLQRGEQPFSMLVSTLALRN